MQRFKQPIFFILLVTNLITCSTTATIYKTDGHEVEAKILNSDNENIFVKTYGKEFTIPRDNITDVDHPGNVSAIISGAIAVSGISYAGYNFKNDNFGRALGSCLFSVAGLIAAYINYGKWNTSLQAVEMGLIKYNTSDIFINPSIAFIDKDKHYGLSFSSRF